MFDTEISGHCSWDSTLVGRMLIRRLKSREAENKLKMTKAVMQCNEEDTAGGFKRY
jgi:hypothetical protein